MKKFAIISLIVTLLVSCDDEINPCIENNPVEVSSKEGLIRYDDRFKQRVIRVHVAGSIDSFEVYLPCELSDSFKVDTQVQFSAWASSFDGRKYTKQSIGVEQFYAIKLINIEAADTQ